MPNITKLPTASCCSYIDVLQRSFEFSITDFSLRWWTGRIASSMFDVAGHKWSLVLRKVFQNFQIGLVHHGSTEVHVKYTLTLDSITESYRNSFVESREDWIKHTPLTKLVSENGLFKDDTLVIICDLSVYIEHLSEPEANMGKQMLTLLDSNHGADVVFNVQEQQFKAHKAILAARSPVFRAQFFGPLKDSAVEVIHVDYVEPQVFKALLQYMYGDQVPEDLSFDFVSKVLMAADLYGLEHLVRHCVHILKKEVSADTSEVIFDLADRYQLAELKQACFQKSASIKTIRC